MTTTNDVTGDRLASKPNSKKYRDNWDKIFGNKDDLIPTSNTKKKNKPVK